MQGMVIVDGWLCLCVPLFPHLEHRGTNSIPVHKTVGSIAWDPLCKGCGQGVVRAIISGCGKIKLRGTGRQVDVSKGLCFPCLPLRLQRKSPTGGRNKLTQRRVEAGLAQVAFLLSIESRRETHREKAWNDLLFRWLPTFLVVQQPFPLFCRPYSCPILWEWRLSVVQRAHPHPFPLRGRDKGFHFSFQVLKSS